MACKYKYKDKWYSEIEVKNQLFKDISLNDVIVELSSQMSYAVEINTAKESNAPVDYVEEQSEYYENQIKYADKFYVIYERENKFIVFSNDFDISRQSSWGSRDINSPKFDTKEEAEVYRKQLVNNKIKSDTEKLNEVKEFKPSLENTQYYSNLTVPGGTNYTENEIATPGITPSIKGHAQFATDKGIGWFRSDDKTDDSEKAELERIAKELNADISDITPYGKTTNATKTRRILEVQSDWGQKQRKSSEPDINVKYDIQQIINDLEKSGDLKIDCN
jgi:hypothetical protein